MWDNVRLEDGPPWSEVLIALFFLVSFLGLAVVTGIIAGMKQKRSRGLIFFIKVLLTTTVLMNALYFALEWASWKDTDAKQAAQIAHAQTVTLVDAGQYLYELEMPGGIQLRIWRRPFILHYVRNFQIGVASGVIASLIALGVRAITIRVVTKR
jgi:hypothetical protein